MTLTDLLAEAVVNQIASDGERRFSAVIEDGERGLYGISVSRFIDADRAGFVGRVSDKVASGLEQTDAVAMERELNDAQQRIRDRNMARYAS